jgi:rubrerythrin
VAEQTFEVKTLAVEWICDECGTGKMEPIGHVLLSDPPQYPHKCPHCGHRAILAQTYPTIRYERVNNG